MKLWLDDIRPMPNNFTECALSVDMAKRKIIEAEKRNEPIELISLDHDLGEYNRYGGDGIKLLDWLEETGRNYPISLHTMNPVGRQNMLRIIQKNDWEYFQ